MRYTTRDPTIRVLALSGVVPYFLLIPAWGTLFPVFAKDIWAAGPQGLGILLGAVGLGGLLGGIVGTYTARLDRLGAISLAALALFAGSLIAIGLSPTVYAALPFVVLAGVGEMLNATTNQTLVQMVAPDHMRGRVTSLLAVYPAFISVGAVIVGAGADWLGAPVVTVTLGIAGGTLCAAFWFLAPRLRELRLAHYR